MPPYCALGARSALAGPRQAATGHSEHHDANHGSTVHRSALAAERKIWLARIARRSVVATNTAAAAQLEAEPCQLDRYHAEDNL